MKRVLNFSVVVDKAKDGFVVKTTTPKLFGEQVTTSEKFADFAGAAEHIKSQVLDLIEKIEAS